MTKEQKAWEKAWKKKMASIPDLADYFLGPDPKKTAYYKQMMRMRKE
jgi:hypothetical protein